MIVLNKLRGNGTISAETESVREQPFNCVKNKFGDEYLTV